MPSELQHGCLVIQASEPLRVLEYLAMGVNERYTANSFSMGVVTKTVTLTRLVTE